MYDPISELDRKSIYVENYVNMFELPPYISGYGGVGRWYADAGNMLTQVPRFKLDKCHTLFIPLKHGNQYKLVHTNEGYIVVPSTLVLVVFYINQCEGKVEIYKAVAGVWYHIASNNNIVDHVVGKVMAVPSGGFESW